MSYVYWWIFISPFCVCCYMYGWIDSFRHLILSNGYSETAHPLLGEQFRPWSKRSFAGRCFVKNIFEPKAWFVPFTYERVPYMKCPMFSSSLVFPTLRTYLVLSDPNETRRDDVTEWILQRVFIRFSQPALPGSRVLLLFPGIIRVTVNLIGTSDHQIR